LNLSKALGLFVKDSLYRNTIYLLSNLGVTAVAGFIFTLICTHLYSQREVGIAIDLIAAQALAISISNIGMNRTTVRFFSQSKSKAQDILTKTTLIALSSLLIGIMLCYFFKSFGIKQTSLALYLVFITAVLFGSIKAFFDNVFVAIRSASGTLIENTLFCIFKLFVPIVAISLGFIGIFSAQIVGSIIAVIASIILLKSRLGLNLKTRPSRSTMTGRWRFAFGSYTTDLVGNLPTNVLPIIVVAKLGAVDGALWYVAMQVINFLLSISYAVNQAMFAEMSHDSKSVTKFAKKAAIIMYSLLIPMSIVILIFAPFILKIFNENYLAATHILRLMTLFALIGVVNFISGSILSLYKKIMYLTLVNVVNALVVVLYCVLFARNLNGIAIGWMLGEVANVILFVGGAYVLTHRNIFKNRLISQSKGLNL
jgi:O-antigen/teichoic acid export membrane protein